jgi:hypothetical protein
VLSGCCCESHLQGDGLASRLCYISRFIVALHVVYIAFTLLYCSLSPIQADYFNSVIRRIDMASRTVTTLAGQPGVQSYTDGVGTMATFNLPVGIALNSAGTYAVIVRLRALGLV